MNVDVCGDAYYFDYFDVKCFHDLIETYWYWVTLSFIALIGGLAGVVDNASIEVLLNISDLSHLAFLMYNLIHHNK